MKLFTIGHSNHSWASFARLLEDNGISLLVDVRSAPHSRYNPQFNREALEQKLPEHAIEYAFAGKYLGGRPTDPSCYKKGVLPPEGADYLHEVDYLAVMTRDWFRKGVERLVELTEDNNVAIMCSEESPAQCHRHHLIYKYMREAFPEVDMWHIRGDGNLVRAGSLRASVDKPRVDQPTLL